MSEHYAEVFSLLKKEFPRAGRYFSQPDDLQFVLSPFVIKLPKIVLQKASDAIAALYALSQSARYQESLPQNPILDLKNSSVLMAYDFHANQDGEIKLIEINTNASGYLVSTLLALKNGDRDPRPTLYESFKSEWQSVFGNQEFNQIVLTDLDLEQQKMNFEFAMYQDLFKSFGVECDIVDWKDLGEPKMIYNRHTDFYLKSRPDLLNLALKKQICITPSPKQYLLLADKSRLQLFDAFGVAAINEVLLRSQNVSDLSPEELWSQRKSLYFKPRQSYGGKSVYRGASVTKKTFSRILTEDFLAQDYFPPGIFEKDWKFDLRFYVYRDQIQFSVARVYQGQITNFKTPQGGFARLQFS